MPLKIVLFRPQNWSRLKPYYWSNSYRRQGIGEKKRRRLKTRWEERWGENNEKGKEKENNEATEGRMASDREEKEGCRLTEEV